MISQYLTEKLIGDFLHSRIPNEIIANKRMKINDISFQPDFRIEDLIVEFDGYRHYFDPKRILKDYQFDEYVKDQYSIIRIPYFVQLDERIINFYLEKS